MSYDLSPRLVCSTTIGTKLTRLPSFLSHEWVFPYLYLSISKMKNQRPEMSRLKKKGTYRRAILIPCNRLLLYVMRFACFGLQENQSFDEASGHSSSC